MAQQTQTVEGTREGSRWVNRRPTSEEFAEWFKKNVPIDPALDAEKYVGGVVLIPAEEKVKEVTGLTAEGEIMLRTRSQLTFTPYSKVDARLGYYWDLMHAHREDWHGVSKPVVQARDTDEGSIGRINRLLPDGFFVLPVPHESAYQFFVCCTWRIAIYEKPISYVEIEQETFGGVQRERVIDGEPIREGVATKMIPMIASAFKRGGARGERVFYPDPTSLMKAETGAKGRALGFAGIFVVPGSGVATAEDMYEALGTDTSEAPAQSEPQPPPAPAKPDPPTDDREAMTGAEQAERTRDQMVTSVRAGLEKLASVFPGKYEEFTNWARSTKPPVRDVTELTDARLKGVVKRVEKLIDEAEKARAERGEEVEPEAPAEPKPDLPDPIKPGG